MRPALLMVLAWPAIAQYAGTATCVKCHAAESKQIATPMAHALAQAAVTPVLIENPRLDFASGRFRYSIRRQGERSIYSVTDGTSTIEEPIAWSFGLGEAGQTYVFQHDGAWYESRVSFFNDIQKLDFTFGSKGKALSTLDEAAGRRMQADDARDCFACHSTGGVSSGKLHFDTLVPGVHCESCHGPAAKHVSERASMTRLSALTTEEMSDRCGTCHRSWSQIAASDVRGIQNIRFQPYRLTNSKCYDAADARIRCAACHNVHAGLEREPAAYDAACNACHTIKKCKVATGNCVTCHMPKYELPGARFKFTDHQIRIVRANEKYPN